MKIGSIASEPGETVAGTLEVTDLPTGEPETLPIVIAAGKRTGPTVWITGGVHGDEATGVVAAQDAIAAVDPEQIRGTVVCCPVVNPAGLRRDARQSYYHNKDPNRQFPSSEHTSTRPPDVQDRIAERLFDHISETATAVFDLHTAQTNSIPFTIRDRVLYGEQRDESEAENLSAELTRLVDALRLPVVREYPADEYVEQGLHRSLAGAVLNQAGIPACTVELGSPNVVEDDHRAAGVAAVHRGLVELGIEDTVPNEVADAAPEIEPPIEQPVRRYVGPHTETAGLLRHHVEGGDVVAEGDPIADVVSPTGNTLGTVETDHSGYVLARQHGLAAYEGDPVTALAVHDDGPLVVSRE